MRLEIIPAIRRERSTTKVITITRDKVKLEEQAAKKRLLTSTQGGQVYKIGMIDVPTFYADFKAIQAG